ncbi:hypothetical protein AAFF_G00349900 [Aldrovandia affinis]|uniref:trypsin n=1 Tax=Aldrovandia affinis TaxID=143900 RepID=A0AAD7WPK5_9TELE|nr:hypothetical protein AAFF_G00349900 [Aldrovandia affinis]
MKVVVRYYLLSALLIGYGITESQEQENAPDSGDVNATHVPAVPTAAPRDEYLSSDECLNKRFTHLSCQKVFCPPWMRCINGACSCKLPYMCQKGTPVCSSNKRTYFSFCQVKAVECLREITTFSHIGGDCKELTVGDLFETRLIEDDVVEVTIPQRGTFLICEEGWNMPAANVVCRHRKKQNNGAEKATTRQYNGATDLQKDCVCVKCTGFENSLAECTFHDQRQLESDTKVATATCYPGSRACSMSEFKCVNGKCIGLNSTCDGVNDCGDGSDEMCCKACRDGFHCTSDVCIPTDAVLDGIVDCLGGEDEIGDAGIKDRILSPIKQEIKIARDKTETLVCGKANDTLETTMSNKSRRKRIVGGQEAGKTQFPWQVAIQEDESIDCGGIYIGDCWVLTAAHCVRPRPEAYRIKFSLWSKLGRQDSTDFALVDKVIIHHQFNSSSYENDIALLQLKKLPFSSKCYHDNPAIAAACVPWSEYQFKPGHQCTISGWGRQGGDKKSQTLRWANIEIIGNCSGLYGSRYFDGMLCAGALDGSVDTCQGDSGGPLVCKDARDVAYVWGIVSWGEKCGVAGHPGVYTKVAHYYEWMSSHIGRSSISRYNV